MAPAVDQPLSLPPGPMRGYLEMSLLNVGAAHAYMTGYDFSLIILTFYAVGMTAVKLLEDGLEVATRYEQRGREDSALAIRGRPLNYEPRSGVFLCPRSGA